jgi:hypothetical protein
VRVSDDKKPPSFPVGSLGDLDLLPGEFRMFRSEVRTSLEILTEKLVLILDRIEPQLDDLKVRVARIERDRVADSQRIAALEQQNVKRRKAARRK